MISLLLRRLVPVFFYSSVAAFAAPMTPDPTGYWFNPSEAGWGLSVAQQNDVLFASLLVYDEQRRPTWFVATSVKSTGNGVYAGPLYRSSGPFFGTSFDPSTVGAEAVGTLSVHYIVDFAGGQTSSLQLAYTVNGTSIAKTLTRMTWDSNATRLIGGYYGGINVAIAPLPQPFSCPDNPNTYFPPGGEIHINMSEPNTIAIIRGEGVDVLRIIGGVYQQTGQAGTITGKILSGPVPSPFPIGDALITNLVVQDDGFVGHLRLTVYGCVFEGSIGGLRRP